MGVNYGGGSYKKDLKNAFRVRLKQKSHQKPSATGGQRHGNVTLDIMSDAQVEARKSTIHTFGLLHDSVNMIMIYTPENNNTSQQEEERILLEHRSGKKVQWKGYWGIPGEHIFDRDISPLEIAKHTIIQELGSDFWHKPTTKFVIENDRLVYTAEMQKKYDIQANIDIKHKKYSDKIDVENRYVFVIPFNEMIPLDNLKSTDTIEYKWFTKTNLEKLLGQADTLPPSHGIIPYSFWHGIEDSPSFSEFFKSKALEHKKYDGSR